MNTLRIRARLCANFLIVIAFSSFANPSLKAQEEVAVTEITPTLLVFATETGNVVASVGPDFFFVLGTT